ncbi:GNAT family N-acetyltransferase [Amycolatopsis minnesotensis]|uniref:GNAT family N-acetyltransferase n=1 Tax=Amycolatopsis minnesotensis TaxID=337894 RepID=A0ABN2SBL1_9PSEU
MVIEPVPYDHPDAALLTAQVQRVYEERYGEADVTPLDPGEFSAPRGLFLVAYADDGTPVASGAWRAHDGPAPFFRAGDAELKRMYVTEAARGRGYARAVLAELERAAVAAGRKRVVLETGLRQPEAIALYRSCGYTDIPNYGVYRDEPDCVCLAKELVTGGLGTGAE